MKLDRLLFAGVLALSLISAQAFAQDDKAKKQAEIRKSSQATLEKFYKADPKLKGEVAKAPGYGVFTTFGLSFIIGGSGGKGVVHDAKSKTDTFMSMGQASAGLQAGIAETETLIIFKSAKSMSEFVNKGWEFGGGGSATAGAGGKSVGGGSGDFAVADALYFTLTKNGLQAGGAVAGTKFWKDKDLN